MDRWRGKVAIVTGASAGIGVEIVKQLVDEGVLVNTHTFLGLVDFGNPASGCRFSPEGRTHREASQGTGRQER